MSRTVAFGMDALGSGEDLEELLAALTGDEVTALVDEMASDPDDVHLPASVRNSYRCAKEATGALNRDSLITYINEEGMKDPGKEDIVPFEAGKKRGHVYIPKYNEAELEAMAKKEADAVTLECDEEEALGQANTQDLMSLAEILDSNPQDFIMEIYADDLKYFEPDTENKTNVPESIDKVKNNEKDLKELNLNNIKDIKEEQFVELFDAFKRNENLESFSAVNCDISDFSIATLNCALEQNQGLKSLNLESNKIGPNLMASLFEALNVSDSRINTLHLTGQEQQALGYKIESRIADAICKNKTVVKIGLKFQFTEVYDRISKQLIDNIDRLRKERVKNEGPSQVKWKPPKTID